MEDQVAAIKLRDIEIFLQVSRAKSIREVARRTGLTPGQVSKAIQQLEIRLGTKLYRRSVSGMLPTNEGAELLEIAKDLIANGERIEDLVSGKKKGKFVKVMAIAATSFLNTHLVTPVVCRCSHQTKETTFRFLDVAPDQLVPVALRGGFEIALHHGSIAWPNTWTSKRLGKTKWVLCAGANHALSKRPTVTQMLGYRFVVPTYWTVEGLSNGNDQFPIPISKRKHGFETATADAAIPILMETDHLAFLPEILARPYLADQRLKELRPPDIRPVERELFLSARADSVSAMLFNAIAEQAIAHIAR